MFFRVLFISIFIVYSAFAKNYFPTDYENGKAKFLALSSILKKQYPGIQQGKFIVGEEQLSTDYTYIKASGKNENLLVISSGTHGPEGYTGTALQTLFMEKLLPKMDLSKTGVLLVHALNPWGYKYSRRGTERNVNLNRNFYTDTSIFSTENQSYKKLEKYLEVRTPIESLFNFPAFPLLKEIVFTKGVTVGSLTEAIGRGQYSNPKGINYGGASFEPQTKQLIDLYKEITPQYEKILHIDIHTGLGDRGVLHVMRKPTMSLLAEEKFKKMFLAEDAKDLYEVNGGHSTGFYEIIGDHAKIISLLNPKDKLVIGITAEFGTLGNGLWGKIKTINRLIRENRGHFAGYGDEKTKKQVQRDYLELFNPSAEEWRGKVIKSGEFLLDTVVSRFLKE